MWVLVGTAVLILCGASSIPFGAWVIANSRLPSWMKGSWKWPLGDNLSPEVAVWHGSASLLVGTAALVLLIPLLRLPLRDAVSRDAVAVAVLLVVVGVAAYLRTIALSYRPVTTSGSAETSAMRKETTVAVAFVAGLVLGALLTADVVDAFPDHANNANQASPIRRAEGLQSTDVQLGTGTAAAAGKLLTIRYTVWLGDGTRIDSSTDRATPFTFTMGKGEVIKGLDEGVVGMRVGGIRWLTIPAPLAYGASGATGTPGPGIPPNATLVMLVELLAVGR